MVKLLAKKRVREAVLIYLGAEERFLLGEPLLNFHFSDVVVVWASGLLTVSYNGMFPCFLDGLGSRFVAKLSNALISFGLVSAGSITSSI